MNDGINESVNESMSDKGVFRTAPVLPRSANHPKLLAIVHHCVFSSMFPDAIQISKYIF